MEIDLPNSNFPTFASSPAFGMIHNTAQMFYMIILKNENSSYYFIIAHYYLRVQTKSRCARRQHGLHGSWMNFSNVERETRKVCRPDERTGKDCKGLGATV